jgi:enamine deaminase RidA (YjgF/YER057c/UK114 family)
MSRPPTYSHVVEVNGPHRTVYLAGQTGVDATGKVAEGFRAQAVQVIENIKTALASVGGGFEHIVNLTSYLTSLEANAAEFREIRGSYFPNKQALRLDAAAGAAPRQPRLPARGRGNRGAAARLAPAGSTADWAGWR